MEATLPQENPQTEIIVNPKRKKRAASSTALVAIPATPADLLRIAVTNGAGLEQIEKLMDLQERYRQQEARSAFVQAMSDFKAHAIVVLKDKINPQYNSKYVSLGNLVATVTPFLSQHQLSVHWNVDQTQPPSIKVTAIVTHALGHAESVSMVVPPDTSGSKNVIQQIKSAITYAKACTFESICGLASTDATLDDDGNAAGTQAPRPHLDDLQERLEYLANCRTIEELQGQFKAAYSAARDLNDQDAMRQIIAAKDRRKKELQ